MLDSRQRTRARLNQQCHHDSIALDDKYGDIEHREGRVLTTEVPPVTVQEVIVDASEWQNTLAWGPADDENFALDPPGGHMYEESLDRDVGQQPAPPVTAPKKVYTKSRVSVSICITEYHICVTNNRSFRKKRPHVVWMEVHRETYLHKFMRWEGRGDALGTKVCPDCKARCSETPGEPRYRCKDCLVPDLVCRSCCMHRHC